MTVARAAHRDVECAAPALLGVIDQLRSRRREAYPRLIEDLEDHPDPAGLGAFRDPPGHVASRELALQAISQSLGFLGVETFANELLEIIAELLADLVRRPLDLDALDHIAGVDVLGEIRVVTDSCDKKDDAGLSVRSRDAAHRRDDFRLLGLDASGQLVESLTIEGRSDQ